MYSGAAHRILCLQGASTCILGRWVADTVGPVDSVHVTLLHPDHMQVQACDRASQSCRKRGPDPEFNRGGGAAREGCAAGAQSTAAADAVRLLWAQHQAA